MLTGLVLRLAAFGAAVGGVLVARGAVFPAGSRRGRRRLRERDRRRAGAVRDRVDAELSQSDDDPVATLRKEGLWKDR